MTTYPPIEAHGLIGDLLTCALVSREGVVDWCPVPDIESPSVFASILDADRGGHFAVAPDAAFESTQSYVDRTNVLQTTFTTELGDVRVTDFMVPTAGDVGTEGERALYRKVEGISGTVPVEVDVRPRFDYGRAATTLTHSEGAVVATADGVDEKLVLASSMDLAVEDGATVATTSLSTGDVEWVVARFGPDPGTVVGRPERVLSDTVSFWHGWVHTCDVTECVFGGPWHDLAVRSGLTLKLLTHVETGAVAAAPTTSLPEDVGGVRNWDYRYNWIRDAAFTVQALVNLGHTAEAMRYVEWFVELCDDSDPAQIQPLYGLHGESELPEAELDHLSGYRGSSPVRIGNGAADQRQLDIYGELLLAISETDRFADVVSAEDWPDLRAIVEYVRDVWQEKDAGIWEVRGGPKHFVFSKVMCWVALDRGIDVAERHGFDAPVDEWHAERDRIEAAVLEDGYTTAGNYFLQAFGDETTIDATGLLLPVVGFLPIDDERVQGTIDAVQSRLTTPEGLVRRYDGDDGLPGEEGAFLWCSFWLVDALALSGRVDEARDVLTSLMDVANPLGLFAEEVDPDTGAHLGNFPQAFSHIGLINSALYLGHVSDLGEATTTPMGVRLSDSPSRR